MPEEARSDDDEREPGRKSYTKTIVSITMVEVKERFDEIRGDVEAKSKIEVLLAQQSFYVTNVEAVPLKHDGTPYCREPNSYSCCNIAWKRDPENAWEIAKIVAGWEHIPCPVAG